MNLNNGTTWDRETLLHIIVFLIEQMNLCDQADEEKWINRLYSIIEEVTGTAYLDLHGASEKLEWIALDPEIDETIIAHFLAEQFSHRSETVMGIIRDYLGRINDIHGPMYDVHAESESEKGLWAIEF